MITRQLTIPITAAATFVAVKSPEDAPGIPQVYAFYTEDYTDWYISDNAAGTGGVPVPTGTLSMAPSMLIKPDDDGTLFYAKGTTSTNLIVWRGLR